MDNHKFTLALDMKFKDAKTLVTEGIYIFVGKNWLITIHSNKIDLLGKVRQLFEEKNKEVLASSINALYYSILSNIVSAYEQLMTSIELSIADFDQTSLYNPSKRMLEYLDTLSRQLIIMRRNFWHTRDTINLLTHLGEDKVDIKYLKIVHDNTDQLIDLIESYRDTINSTRGLYIASVSLQMNDTVRTLTIFSAIILPLSLIASMYGMNGIDLNNISNLPSGFVVLIGAMAVISAGLFVYFKRKQWILTKEPDVDYHVINGKGSSKNIDDSEKHRAD